MVAIIFLQSGEQAIRRKGLSRARLEAELHNPAPQEHGPQPQQHWLLCKKINLPAFKPRPLWWM